MNKASSSFITYSRPQYTNTEMAERAHSFAAFMNERRTVRTFNSEPIPDEVIKHLILTANSAPSGANKQPWTFCVVKDPTMKSEIRAAAEQEEHENYTRRMNENWLDDLEPLGTNAQKPFLEEAPALIVVMKQAYGIDSDNNREQHYYVNESVGIACGMLLAAIHHAGLVAVTHTPSPMMFLKRLLKRPKNEQPYLLIPVGRPHQHCKVPNISRKNYTDITAIY